MRGIRKEAVFPVDNSPDFQCVKMNGHGKRPKIVNMSSATMILPSICYCRYSHIENRSPGPGGLGQWLVVCEGSGKKPYSQSIIARIFNCGFRTKMNGHGKRPKIVNMSSATMILPSICYCRYSASLDKVGELSLKGHQ
jgi:hypothetical protein